MARDLPFDFSLPGPLRYTAFDPLGLYLAVALVGRSTIYVLARLDMGWENLGTPLLGHSGCVVKLTWAHPDHGPMFASAAEDCTIKIWERYAPSQGKASWRLQTTLTMHRERPVDLQFLDEGQRLMLACGSVTGEVVIYTCEDRSRIEWRVMSSFCLNDLSALCWGLGLDNLHLAVGSRGKLHIWHQITDHWVVKTSCQVASSPICIAWSRVAGRKSAFLATGYSSGKIEIYTFPIDAIRLATESVFVLDSEPTSVVRLDWDSLGTYLSVSWASGRVDVLKRTLAKTWKSVANRR